MWIRRLPGAAGRGRALAAMGLVLLVAAGGADGGGADLDGISRQARAVLKNGLAWYDRTPPGERATWGGLAACAALGLVVAMGKTWGTRRGKVLPGRFVVRFAARLGAGKLDRGKGTDFCELNPSPAARVALAAVRRWGRPAGDVERGVALAVRVETDHLRRHVGTVRRVAALAPLVGLLGTLLAAARVLAMPGGAPGQAWGPALAPLTAGVALAILALVAHDGLAGRVEALANDLDRFGSETIDAIMLSAGGEGHGPAIRAPHLHPGSGTHPPAGPRAALDD